MDTSEEGYIKFKARQTGDHFDFQDEDFFILEKWRLKFYQLNFIGAYPDGIGFGNISLRYKNSGQFIISGSATGNNEQLERNQYALVTGYDFLSNSLDYNGTIKASSESLSHAIIYQSIPGVNGVIHIHHATLWKKMINELPTTAAGVTYGTPEMAEEIERLIKQEMSGNTGLIIMGGHEEGIISFGKDLNEAGSSLLDLKERYHG